MTGDRTHAAGAYDEHGATEQPADVGRRVTISATTRAAAWRAAVPDITDRELTALDPLIGRPARMRSMVDAYRAGRRAVLPSHGEVRAALARTLLPVFATGRWNYTDVLHAAADTIAALFGLTPTSPDDDPPPHPGTRP